MSVQYREAFTMPITVDDYPLPYIERYPGERPDGGISLTLDGRFGLDTTEEECARWLPFLANAMAVAAGRTSHGANSNIRNPHGEALAGYPTERIVGTPLAEVDA